LPLREFAALVSKCRLYVGNDTGATHMAAALGRRIVVIFGSSDFRVWSPWRVEHRLVRSDLPCVPCPGYRCLHYPDPRCIRAIETGPVLEAIRELL
jgi:heptosyltransferase-3